MKPILSTPARGLRYRHRRFFSLSAMGLMLAMLLTLLTLLAIFMSYLSPGFVLDIANRFVLCF